MREALSYYDIDMRGARVACWLWVGVSGVGGVTVVGAVRREKLRARLSQLSTQKDV